MRLDLLWRARSTKHPGPSRGVELVVTASEGAERVLRSTFGCAVLLPQIALVDAVRPASSTNRPMAARTSRTSAPQDIDVRSLRASRR
jgi:hypothetical protein